MTVDSRHPFWRNLEAKREETRVAQEAYDIAKRDHDALKQHYADTGAPTLVPVRQRWSSRSHSVPRDLSDSRSKQTEAKRRLTRAQQAEKQARFAWENRAVIDRDARRQASEAVFTGDYEYQDYRLYSPSAGEGILFEWRQFMNKAADAAARMNQELSDLRHYAEDTGVTLDFDDLEQAAREALYGSDYLVAAESMLPHPDVMRPDRDRR